MMKETCEHCGRELDSETMVLLELNAEMLTWHIPGTIPKNESQGCFPFGKACAAKVLKRKSWKATRSFQ